MHLLWLIYTNVQNIFQDASIVLHRPAKVLGGCLAAARVNRDIVRAAVFVDGLRVLDGKVDGALFEVTRGITARTQRLVYQAIGACQRFLRTVDKKFLDVPPLTRETARLLGVKPPDMQLLYPFLPLFEDGLGAGLISMFLAHYAVVLGTEFGAELPRPIASVIQRKSDDDYNNRHDNDYQDCG
jgi:hypothetical protein